MTDVNNRTDITMFLTSSNVMDSDEWHDNLIQVKKNGKYGIMNSSGKWVFPCIYQSLSIGVETVFHEKLHLSYSTLMDIMESQI